MNIEPKFLSKIQLEILNTFIQNHIKEEKTYRVALDIILKKLKKLEAEMSY